MFIIAGGNARPLALNDSPVYVLQINVNCSANGSIRPVHMLHFCFAKLNSRIKFDKSTAEARCLNQSLIRQSN